jgi:beta-lactamase regulating signal transducer with metallopeptidase domain
MKPILLYLLQVIISSGLLYGYYHLFLRNKRFHLYNRYYLLAATVISIFVPFLNIPVYFSQHDEPAVWLQTLSGFSSAEAITVTNAAKKASPLFTWQQALTALYIVAGAFILIRFIVAIIRIRSMLRKYEVEQLGDIYFVNTEEQGTPFSFFRWMFWNNKITLQSDNGQQIFRHELFHIKQKHSWDIVFIELLSIIFWINPFFHLIKKELKAIHEFLADQFAIKENDQWNYAELLLMHLMGTPNLRLTQPFFHNQIKRRIAMITSSQKPKYQYFRKVLVLPLLALIAILFAFTYRQKQEPDQRKQNELSLRFPDINWKIAEDTPGKKKRDEIMTIIADSILIREDVKGGSKPKVELFIVDDENYTPQEFRKKFNEIMFSGKVTVTPANNADAIKKHGQVAKNGVIEITRGKVDMEGTGAIIEVEETEVPLEKVMIQDLNKTDIMPLYIIDGKIIEKGSENILAKLDPNTIKTINVLKDHTATDIYGPKGINGVIEIITKLKETLELKEVSEVNTEEELNEVVVVGHKIDAQRQPQFPGEEEGWRKYLQKNLKADISIDNGAAPGKYSVSVKFMVADDGTVSDIKPLTNHGYGMEAEVVRVIANGPKWIPATVSGKKIKAYKTQKITFIVVDEDELKELKEVVVMGYPKTPNLKLKTESKEPLRINESTDMSRIADKVFDVKQHEHLSPLYPNPATSNVTIPYNTQVTGEGIVNVMDASGKVVLTKKTSLVKGSVNNINVDLSPLSRGSYFIMITDGGKRPARVYKIVKE